MGETLGLEAIEEGIAIDGKTLRGSKKPGAPGAHLLSALAHRGLMRWAGSTNMAVACRRFAAPPTAALHLIGLALEH